MIQQELNKPIFRLLGEVADQMQMPCFLIGGYVRDLLLQRPTKDIDVVVKGSGVLFAEQVAKRLGKGASLAVFKTFGTAQVKKGDLELEFVGARKESYNRDSRNPRVEEGTIEDDQNRRDFTINALAIGLNSETWGMLVDPFFGQRDLDNRVIRTPLDPNVTFSDDPLRMLRAIRFATQLSFFIETETFAAIAANKERIKIITQERILSELNKIMQSAKPSVGFLLLEKSGLLELILPELNALKGIDKKNGVGHKDNFVHTLKVLDKIASQTDDLWLRWAALFHDVGKPRTKQWFEKQGWTFRNHDFVGAKMIPHIFRRMKLPMGEPMKFVRKMVELHMRPIVLSEDVVTDSAVRRLLFDAGNDIDSLMLLCEADITSGNKEKVERFMNNFQTVRQKLKTIEEKDRIRNFQPPISGEEIMQIFSLPPCALVGEIKMAIKDAILDGKIPNEREAAYDFMMKNFKKE
ncbi:MAG: HD domain-containing protein [Paludibacteraceae bacterium]|nr:HD domain-containing protein [Paludibacteraceae bacterium]